MLTLRNDSSTTLSYRFPSNAVKSGFSARNHNFASCKKCVELFYRMNKRITFYLAAKWYGDLDAKPANGAWFHYNQGTSEVCICSSCFAIFGRNKSEVSLMHSYKTHGKVFIGQQYTRILINFYDLGCILWPKLIVSGAHKFFKQISTRVTVGGEEVYLEKTGHIHGKPFKFML